MILNVNEIKKLEKLESQPLRERMKATWDRDDIWQDRFHKSADRMYGIGATYFTRVVKASIGGFLYIELLDASFSFDGVIGAFAITSDVVIIMLGLAIGAMAVRCLTVYLVKEGTLDDYRYLEHGAMYAIGALALILLSSSFFHLPEIVTGLIGVAFIGTALYHSIKVNKKEALIE